MATPARSETASKERFFRYFQHEVVALQDQMSRLASTSPTGGERNDAIDHCLAGISRLSSEVKDASSYIPAYDQRTYGEAIKALQEKLQGVRNELGAGQKKFTFKTKKNQSALSIGDAMESANKRLMGPGGWDSEGGSSGVPSAFSPTPLDKMSPGEEIRETELELIANGTGSPVAEPEKSDKDGVVDGTGVIVSGLDGAHEVVPAEETRAGSSGTISNIKRSLVDLSRGGQFATLTLKNIGASFVECGRVDGPIHITGVENSVIVTSCRQFRMHGSKNVDVYLHCMSRPIIEDCEQIQFAPLPQGSELIDESTTPNQWDQIDDFKWLKAEPSPHFSILPESDRFKEHVWKNKVPDGLYTSLNDILHAVGVPPSFTARSQTATPTHQ